MEAAGTIVVTAFSTSWDTGWSQAILTHVTEFLLGSTHQSIKLKLLCGVRVEPIYKVGMLAL